MDVISITVYIDYIRVVLLGAADKVKASPVNISPSIH